MPPLAVALAVIISPDEKLMPVLAVHVPLALTVVVEPCATLFLNTWITVPDASVEVPETEVIVVVVQYVPVTVGAVVFTVTVELVEAADKQSVPEIALAVIT